MKVIENEEMFNTEIAKGTVVVDFYATWCGPCRMVGPLLEEIDQENEDINLLKVDVDENNDLANRFRVSAIPTILVFKDGELKDRQVGFASKKALLDFIKNA